MPVKQFCLRGHDTFVVGRKKNYTCKACEKDRQPDRYAWVKRRMQDPAYRARQQQQQRDYVKRMMAADPEWGAKRGTGWRNPKRAIDRSLWRIRKRRARTVQQIKELLAQLEGETNA